MANLTRSSARPTDFVVSHSDLNRRVLSLVGGFRLLVAVALVLVAVFPSDPLLLGQQHPVLFIVAACAYCLGAVVIALGLRGDRWSVRLIAWLQLAVDIICITVAVYASGGIGSGLEALLVVFVVSSGMTLSAPGSYFAAALAALAILLEQSLSFLQGVTQANAFIPAGVTGAIMLVITLAIQPIIRRVSETEELARQRGIDLRNLGQLNEYIIQNLREAILVVDERRAIRLINQAAAELLGISGVQAGDQLSKVAPQVYALLRTWQESGRDRGTDIPSFLSQRSTAINVHIAPLGGDGDAGPALIFLEDASLLAEKVQQSKLAALGRLSASIAHEIRNPIGALSHAAQLLQESADLQQQDRRFIDIIQTNSRRVSEIVDNILQLSRKDVVVPKQLDLAEWTRNFVGEFVSTLELYEGQLSCLTGDPVEVRMDPGHLHQVVWNLCENAVKYASETAGGIAVELSYGRLPNNGRPFLEVADQGPGIPADLQETIFEPFATGRRGGTGLGLYICRELCERNGGALRYRPREAGGSIFQLVFSDPERWEISAFDDTMSDESH